jgi:hypothetical protein
MPKLRPHGESLQSAHCHPSKAGCQNPFDDRFVVRKRNSVKLDIVLYYLPRRFIEIGSHATVVVYIADQHQNTAFILGSLLKKTE